MKKAAVAKKKLTPSKMRLKLWRELAYRNPNARECLYVMRRFPQLRELAWKAFIKASPNTADLLELMANFHLHEYHSGAMVMFLALNPNPLELVTAIGRVPDGNAEAGKRLLLTAREPKMVWVVYAKVPALKKEAAQIILVSLNVNMDMLRQIMDDFPELALPAGFRIIRTAGSVEDLVKVARNVPLLAEEAAGMYLAAACASSDKVNNDWLITAMCHLREGAEVAWSLLVKPTPSQLVEIIKNVEAMRERAWLRLIKDGTSVVTLEEVAREVPSLKDRAMALLARPRSDILDELAQLQ